MKSSLLALATVSCALATLPCHAQSATSTAEPARLEGSVANEVTGEPLRKTHLSLRSLDQADSTYTSLTTPDGRFLFSDVKPGRYTLTAEHNGFAAHTYSGAPQGAILTLMPGRTLSALRVLLTPLAVISGTVTDEDGDPLPGISVQVLRLAWRTGQRQLLSVNQTITDDLGSFRLSDLPAGRYYLQAKRRAAETDIDAWTGTVYYPNAREPLAATLLPLKAGAALRGINLQLRRSPAVNVSGRVLLSGLPARAGMVKLRPAGTADADLDREVEQIREGGKFVLHGVSPGTYTLSVEQFAENGRPRSIARLPVTVHDSNVDGLELSLTEGAVIQGKLRYESRQPGLPSPQMKVMLLPRNQTALLGATGGVVARDSTFTLAGVYRDVYDVDVSGLPANAFVKTIQLGSMDIGTSGLDFSSGVNPAELSILVSDAGGRIEGVADPGANKSIGSIRVVAVPEGARREQTRFFRLTDADDHGHFELKGIPPGEYRVFAFDRTASDDTDDGFYRDPLLIQQLEDQGTRVTVGENSIQAMTLKTIATDQ